MVICNWRDVTPVVGHKSAIIWSIFREKGAPEKTEDEAPLLGVRGFTLHMMQGGKSGDYHEHADVEQIYYFIRGRGKMKIDDEIYDVKEGDSVHLPPKTRHQLINDGQDWIEHLIVSSRVEQA